MLILHFILLASLPAGDKSVTVVLARIVLSKHLSLCARQHLRGRLRFCILHDINLRQAESVRRGAYTHGFLFYGAHCGYSCPEILVLVLRTLRGEATNEVQLVLRQLEKRLLIITLALFVCGIEELMILREISAICSILEGHLSLSETCSLIHLAPHGNRRPEVIVVFFSVWVGATHEHILAVLLVVC